MSGMLFSLRQVTLPASGGRESPDVASASKTKHNQGIDIPRSPFTRLNSITLDIPSGVTAVVGLSGAGKTSLLNVLAGFETSFSGTLELCHIAEPVLGGRGGIERSEGSPGTPQQNSGVSDYRLPTPATLKLPRLPLYWVPQNGGLWPHLSVEQHLAVVCTEVPQNSNPLTESGQFSKRTDELLSLFDLNHRRQALPAELSQGERSRLALARALATRANVLLLDEPLSHVDPVRKPAYWKVVRQVVAKENISMVFTSHEPETVLRQAENVICLEAGAVAFEGSVRTLYDNPPNRQIGEFLGPLNWFARDEMETFLVDQAGDADVAIRPERLLIEMLADSPIEFVSQLFAGLYAESVVRHSSSGATKSVLHQVSHPAPRASDRVSFRVLPPSEANS